MTNPAQEYEAVHRSAGVFDLSARGKIRVTGNDRVNFLHRILTQDIESLKPGDSVYAALLSAQGKILVDMDVSLRKEDVLLDLEPGLEKKALEIFNKYLITDDVTLEDATQSFALVSIQGPKAETFGLTAFSRSRTSENGFDIWLKKGEAEDTIKKILEKGKALGIRQVGTEAAQWLRIEAGIPRYGVDMDEDVTLPEAGLENSAASETKGCYPGQEVVARMKTYSGHAKKLTRFNYEGGKCPARGDEIYSGGKKIGWITSACILPSGKGAALGYLTKGWWGQQKRGTYFLLENGCPLFVTAKAASG